MTYRHHYAGRQAWSRVLAAPLPDPALMARYPKKPLRRPYQTPAPSAVDTGLRAYLLSIADEDADTQTLFSSTTDATC